MRIPQNKKRIWAADCESDPFLHGRVPIPFAWGVYDGKEYHEFLIEGLPPDPSEETLLAAAIKNTRRFVEFVSQHDILLYAHNGGKFDWHFLTSHLEPRGPLLIIAGRLSKFVIGQCEFRDSYNLLPISLAQYQKEHIDYWKMERSVRHLHMPEISSYLKSDCVNLWNMVSEFEADYGRHLTQAGAAMKIWRGMVGRQIKCSKAYFYDLLKPYYFGGRVQCFEAGDIEINSRSLDMRSAYPSAMLQAHPVGVSYHVGDDSLEHPLEKMGHAFFTVRCTARGCFPLRTINGALYFPSDDIERTYTVTGWELLAAIETKSLENWRILKHLLINDTLTFHDYVMRFWEVRKRAKAAGDHGRDHFGKIFLNGLYGKFASDPRAYKVYELYPPGMQEEITAEGKDYGYFREWLLASSPAKPGKWSSGFYNLATAASITGLVRARLWRAIRGATRPLYCDTDSLTATGFAGLELGKELGQWGVEGEYDRAVIAGKKMYAFHLRGRPLTDWTERRYEPDGSQTPRNWKRATKGANLTAQELIRVMRGESVQFLPPVPTFSAHAANPRFTPRIIKFTAADISRVPRHLDPEFIGGPPSVLPTM